MKRLFFLISIAVLLLTSCSGNKIFEKHHKFDNNIWSKTEVVNFDVNIEDVELEYDIFVAIRHMSVYPYANVVVGLTIATPTGETRMMQHDLIIRNTDGSFKGDGLGDIWDIEVPVFNKYRFNTEGLHTFSIENRMHLTEMPAIMEIGLAIKKTE